MRIILLLLFFLMSYNISYSATLYVGSCGTPNYPNLQSAVDNASDNDIIKVCNGTYNFRADINKTLTIEGITTDPNNVVIQNNAVVIFKSLDKIQSFFIFLINNSLLNNIKWRLECIILFHQL